jgi:hypothetical protein
MKLTHSILLLPLAALLLCFVMLWPRSTRAQNTAQIGNNSPLPVYVTNNPGLPDGFTPGTNWRFTTWTTPSVFRWTATVGKTAGPWAYLTVRTDDGQSNSRWYYVPAMPGSWEPQ